MIASNGFAFVASNDLACLIVCLLAGATTFCKVHPLVSPKRS